MNKLPVSLVWCTPDGDNLVAKMARVSNPSNENNTETAPKLIKYLMDNAHWSPFEMVHACVEINTTRDIGRQLLRHKSFSFQEFSQRYADPTKELSFGIRETRLQDTKNRQNSLEINPKDILHHSLDLQWRVRQQQLLDLATDTYVWALYKGVAKEVARAVLPEGLIHTRMYMVGSLRSWIHFWDVRCDAATQKETRIIANLTKYLILKEFPNLGEVLSTDYEKSY
jgi:thymidylate synthase (FAD)